MSFNESGAFAESLALVFNRVGRLGSKARLLQVLNSDLLRSQEYYFTLDDVFCLFFNFLYYSMLYLPHRCVAST